MKRLISITKSHQRLVVVESDMKTNQVLDKIKSMAENDINFFKTEKINTYFDCENVSANVPITELDNMHVDYLFVDEKNTVRARQYAQSICEMFEEILEKHDITVPDPNRDSQGEGEEAARIYGETYFNLEDDITNMITDIINRVKRDEIKVISDTY